MGVDREMKEYVKSPYVEKSKDDTFTAGIDVWRNYGGFSGEQYHLSAIEFHHKNEAEAVKLRDLVFDFLDK